MIGLDVQIKRARYFGNNFIRGGDKCKSESDWVDTDDEEPENMDDELNIDENVQYKEDDTHFYSFLPDHPQCGTHEIQCNIYLIL